MDKRLKFAADELNKYYKIVTGAKLCEISLMLSEKAKEKDIFADSFTIDVVEGKGTITGINERSVLFGVYRLFKHFGYTFLKAGRNGEIPIHIEKKQLTLQKSYCPSYKHRGITIEGAASFEHVVDLIDWMAKNDFNCYFIQFRNAYEFFERWYLHKNNDCVEAELFTDEMCTRYKKEIVKEIKKRGLIYHAVGHGWTSEAVGISVNGWCKMDISELKEKNRGYLAKINGERKFFEGIPLNTHLCYSNPEVKSMLVDEVVRYAAANSEIDVLHFWLGDNYNNACECSSCKNTLMADFYVEFLNEIDRRLTEQNISTKLVFLVYLELYWAPKTARIQNSDRFILMFAPIFRTYSKPYADGINTEHKIPEYHLNKVKYSSDVQDYVAFLRDWQTQFNGDSFCFDYHLMWDINRDFSGLTLSKVLFQDIVTLKQLGLDGYLSCQIQRAFFPNGLCMTVLAKTLFDSTLSYEEIQQEYYQKAFGAYAKTAEEVYETIQKTVSFEYLRDELPFDDEKSLKGFLRAKEAITEAVQPLKDFKKNFVNNCQSENIKLLILLCDYLCIIAPLLAKNMQGGDKTEILEKYQEARKLMCMNEKEFSNSYDLFYLNLLMDSFIARENKVGKISSAKVNEPSGYAVSITV